MLHIYIYIYIYERGDPYYILYDEELDREGKRVYNDETARIFFIHNRVIYINVFVSLGSTAAVHIYT